MQLKELSKICVAQIQTSYRFCSKQRELEFSKCIYQLSSNGQCVNTWNLIGWAGLFTPMSWETWKTSTTKYWGFFNFSIMKTNFPMDVLFTTKMPIKMFSMSLVKTPEAIKSSEEKLTSRRGKMQTCEMIMRWCTFVNSSYQRASLPAFMSTRMLPLLWQHPSLMIGIYFHWR